MSSFLRRDVCFLKTASAKLRFHNTHSIGAVHHASTENPITVAVACHCNSQNRRVILTFLFLAGRTLALNRSTGPVFFFWVFGLVKKKIRIIDGRNFEFYGAINDPFNCNFFKFNNLKKRKNKSWPIIVKPHHVTKCHTLAGSPFTKQHDLALFSYLFIYVNWIENY